MITIITNADFTPPGKRGARIIQTSSNGRQLRWYVSGRIYNKMALNGENVSLTNEWLAS